MLIELFVKKPVLSASHYLKVVGRIIRPTAVDVVNNFRRKQFATQLMSSNKAAYPALFSIDQNAMVSLRVGPAGKMSGIRSHEIDVSVRPEPHVVLGAKALSVTGLLATFDRTKPARTMSADCLNGLGISVTSPSHVMKAAETAAMTRSRTGVDRAPFHCGRF